MSAHATPANGIGQPVRRTEDRRLLTGRGCFADDLRPPGVVHAVLLRAPHAHARITAIDTAAARAAPGVHAVLTGADYQADGLGPIPHNVALLAPPDVAARLRGPAPSVTPHWPLPPAQVRFAGEAVAMVVADSIAQAKDAAEHITVRYAPLPAVARAADAVQPGAPLLWDQAPGNLSAEIEVGDEAATDTAFARAAHVVRLDTWVPRVTGVPMEPRTTTAALRSRHRAHHPAHRQRPRGRQAANRSRADAGRAARAGAGDLRRHGRQFRHPQLLLPGIRAGFLGRAPPRPAGEMDLRAERILPHRLPGPRPRRAGGAGARRGRHLPRPARTQPQQPRRLRRLAGVVAERRRSDDRGVPHPHRLRARARRGDQHGADHALSQRRAAGGDLRAGTADRPGRGGTRLRPGGAAPAQPDPAAGAALRQPARSHLRQRRLPGGDGPHPRRGRLGRLPGPPRRRARTRPAARHRGRQLCRGDQRRPARTHRDHTPRRRHGGAGAGHHGFRPGPRHQLRPARHQLSRRAVRQRDLYRPRHGPGAGRRRLALRPLDETRQQHHRHRVRGDPRARRDTSPRPCCRRTRRHWTSRTAASACAAPTAA